MKTLGKNKTPFMPFTLHVESSCLPRRAERPRGFCLDRSLRLLALGADVEAAQPAALRARADPAARGRQTHGDAARAAADRPIAHEQADDGLTGDAVGDAKPGRRRQGLK